jgi:hypothetical protein
MAVLLEAHQNLVVVVAVAAVVNKAIILKLPQFLASLVNQIILGVKARREPTVHLHQPLEVLEQHRALVVVGVALHNQSMALLAVLVHSLLVAVVAVVLLEPASLVALVALAVQDMWRSTHGKLIWRDRRWRCG